jgi:putative hydrolase of the HAD superfamily
MEKIKICQVGDLIDFIIISEDVKVRKPDKGIFEAAMSKINSKPEDCIFIGDTWQSDIIGASGCGIKTIWVNRYNESCPDKSLAYEIHSYDEIENLLGFILE